LVNRLVEAEMLETDIDGAIYFGRAMHLYGAAYAEANPLQRRVRGVLDELAARTEATAQFCALKHDKYVVLDSRSGRGLFRITADIGVPVPLPWTASGRLLLDHLAPEEIRALIPPEDYRLRDGRMVDPDQFLVDVARARKEGFCITEDLADHFCCLAAPIRDARGRAIATLCFVTSVETSDVRKMELIGELLAAVERITSDQRPG
jgi:DNA-binding IclR family transcriptional regulator